MGQDSTHYNGKGFHLMPLDYFEDVENMTQAQREQLLKAFEAAKPILATHTDVGKVIMFGTGGEAPKNNFSFEQLWNKPPSQWP